ncbi:efflux RND transporter periplasmic adaptor subunit [Thalassotalea sp. M1531]|uniref:Efflux RND transporter periplasmic adaptor subunit n=1 Tax=Thalassotalea algicola TaxID=2716224 RepID=A0A7Y0LDS2_9GAMM|nr:efflux RND transporter periplasmic adaptor subunit [Thalassotalea algicola]NMP32576.1 efflux RND transporter periplasmic adaptor subunit [Thalassotalea algicola]
MKKSLLAIITAVSITSTSVYAQQDAPAQLVSVDYAKTEQVSPTMWLPGNVISRRNSPLSAEQTGQLLWIEEVGATVEKGQLLARLDNRHLKLRLAQQKAELKQHKANVVYLEKQKGRMSKLNKMNNTALSELERIEKDLAIAVNEVDALKLSLEQTLLAIEKSEITAPFAGSISQRFVSEGELITSGRPVIQLVDTHHLDVKISAPLSIAKHLQANKNVLVKWQGNLLELPVRTWSQAGDQASRTFDVRLVADGSNMMAGTAVTVSLPKSATAQATLVPRDALVLREQETFIMTIGQDDIANKVNVLVGQGIGKWVSVSGKISAGDEVIIRGGERLQVGQKIRRDDQVTEVAKR